MSDPKVLIVEDSPSLAEVYGSYLEGEALQLEVAATGQAALASLNRETPAAILLDLKLPDMSGMDILRQLRENNSPSAVIVITAHGSIDIAVAAMNLGAVDFLIKPFEPERLLVTLRNALKTQRLQHTLNNYQSTFGKDRFEGFLGRSLAMQSVYRIIEAAAKSRASIFITGESGTGKEVTAQAIHNRCFGPGKPFVALNCGAIPKDLMESEIFGHVKGAFTGAIANRQGAAEQADGGTLFLDEICEMPMELQTKLLRFIQTGTFQKVGSPNTTSVNVRFVCATNKAPLEQVHKGEFREDLYYRLHVIPIELPPLREREDDVLLIAHQLLAQYTEEEGKQFAGFSPEAEHAMLSYPWPGNVRELQNVIRQSVVLNSGPRLELEMLPQALQGIAQTPSPLPPQRPVHNGGRPLEDFLPEHSDEIYPLETLESALIERALTLCDQNITRAAGLLGVNPSTIYRKRQRK